MQTTERTLISYLFFFLFLGAVGYLFFVKLLPITVILIAAYIIEEILYSPVSFLARKKVPFFLAALLCVLIAFSIFGLLFVWLIPLIFHQISIFQHNIPDIVNGTFKFLDSTYKKFSTYFGGIPQGKELLDASVTHLRIWASGLALSSFSGIITGVGEILSMILLPFLVLLMILYRETYQKFFKEFIKQIFGEKYHKVFQDISSMIFEYLKGILIVIIIIGIVTSLGLYFMKINFSLLIGIFSGISFIVPYVGSAVSIAVAVIVSYLQYHSFGVPLEVLIFYLIVHFIGGNILIPLLFSRQLRVDPLSTLVAILIAGGLFGVWGIIVAVPLFGIIIILYRNLLVLLK